MERMALPALGEERDGISGEDEGCASCVSRRTFLERAGIVAAGIIAAGCAGADSIAGVGSGPLPGGSVTINVADYAGLATVGQPVEVKTSTGANLGIAVVRTGTSSFIALGMACTHEGTKVDIIGKIFDCPNHGAQFSSTGTVTRGPATRSLTSRTVTFDQAANTLTIS